MKIVINSCFGGFGISDVDWEISDYDGQESVHEKHRSW